MSRAHAALLCVAASLCLSGAAVHAVGVPTVPLHNAATPGLRMPAVGLGTGGYGSDGSKRYPECWSVPAGCGKAVTNAVTTWLQVAPPLLGDVQARLDCATSYQDQGAVGKAMADSTVARKDIFLLSKIGPSQPLGYNDALAQFKTIQDDMGVSYVDLLLIHWPFYNPSAGNVTTNVTVSTDPACQHKNPKFNGTACRLDTWRALIKIFNDGGAKAIGVSNYNIADLEEIRLAGLPMPALNQCPFHIYRSSTQQELRDYCNQHNITFLGYSPLGVPDWHSFDVTPGMPKTQLVDPVVMSIAKNHPGFTPAQVLLAWEWAVGVPFNPRTMDPGHMAENIKSFELTLSEEEVKQLSSRPNPSCAQDGWYECPTWHT